MDALFNSIFGDAFFNSVLDEFNTGIGISKFLLCIGISLLCGLVVAFSYMFKNRCTKGFAVTLAILPAAVCVVVMMVNGGIGMGLAVAGAFSLVRFRSVPGNASEIGIIFISMGSGLIAGVGFLAYAVLFAVLLSAILVIYNLLGFGGKKRASKNKVMTITIPEDLNYTDVFDDIFDTYTKSHELLRVKTTNMGSMFKLTYNVTLKDVKQEKEMLDKIRIRNGNLEILISSQEILDTQL